MKKPDTTRMHHVGRACCRDRQSSMGLSGWRNRRYGSTFSIRKPSWQVRGWLFRRRASLSFQPAFHGVRVRKR